MQLLSQLVLNKNPDPRMPNFSISQFYFYWLSSSKLTWANANQVKQGNAFYLPHHYWYNLAYFHDFKVLSHSLQLREVSSTLTACNSINKWFGQIIFQGLKFYKLQNEKAYLHELQYSNYFRVVYNILLMLAVEASSKLAQNLLCLYDFIYLELHIWLP